MSNNDHIITLPTIREATVKTPENAHAIVNAWIAEFDKVLSEPQGIDLSTVFRQDGWIRDLLGLSWDFRTINGLEKITAYFKENMPRTRLGGIRPCEKGAFQPSFKDLTPTVHWVESMFDFETNVGRGKGMVRLALEPDDTWKAFMINFTLLEMKGFEASVGLNRPTGYVDPKGGNWKERRERQREFLDEDPAVLVIGAGEFPIILLAICALLIALALHKGHAGINIGVRLRHLGISSLLIDRNKRVGDSWRKRYRVSKESMALDNQTTSH